jgi:hypothetical protein
MWQFALVMAMYKSHKTGGKHSLPNTLTEMQKWLDLVVSAPAECAVCNQAKGDDDVPLLTCGQCRVARYLNLNPKP